MNCCITGQSYFIYCQSKKKKIKITPKFFVRTCFAWPSQKSDYLKVFEIESSKFWLKGNLPSSKETATNGIVVRLEGGKFCCQYSSRMGVCCVEKIFATIAIKIKMRTGFAETLIGPWIYPIFSFVVRSYLSSLSSYCGIRSL